MKPVTAEQMGITTKEDIALVEAGYILGFTTAKSMPDITIQRGLTALVNLLKRKLKDDKRKRT